MTTTQTVSGHNRLLAGLPCRDREQLLANCEQVELFYAEVLYRSGEVIPHIYFPIGSFITLVEPIDEGANLEVGLVGNEGMLGITAMLGVNIAPFQALVQGAGLALRITVPSFLHELERSPALQQMLNRYLYVSMSHIAQTAACTRFHVVEERLARWLLMTQDRAHSDHFYLTHIFLAYMLGIRRVGITKAANSLLKKTSSAINAALSRFSTALAWRLLLAGVIWPIKKPTSLYWVRATVRNAPEGAINAAVEIYLRCFRCRCLRKLVQAE